MSTHVRSCIFFKDDSGNNTRQFTLYSTNGKKETSEWDIGDPVFHGSQNEGVRMDWVADSCWKYIFGNDEFGSETYGYRLDLIDAASKGHKVKVVVNRLAVEATEIMIKDNHLCAFTHNSLSKSTFDTVNTNVLWEWMICCTDGTKNTWLFEYGSPTLNETKFEKADIEWYVDKLEPYNVYSTDLSGAVSDGAKETLIMAAQLGADIRMKIDNGFGQYNIFRAESIIIGAGILRAMNARLISVQSDINHRFIIPPDAFHKFHLINTEGFIDIAKWAVGEHVFLGESSDQLPIDWYATY